MERLQAAIEKARAQRDADKTNAPAAPRAGRAQASPAAQKVQTPPKQSSSETIAERWRAIPELKLRENVLRRNRVLSYQGDAAAVPFDIMRTRMVHQATTNGWRRIAIVSPHSASGKTTLTANLAFGLSRQRDLRSLVFDFDLRRGGLAQVLGQKGTTSMGDMLDGSATFSDVALRYEEGLAFGLGFKASKNPSETLQSPKTLETLEQVEADYAPDLVLFDLPPLNVSDDNLGFLSKVDAALIVIEAQKTGMTQIDVAERQVAELTNVMGIILNKCRFVAGAYGYDEEYY